MAIGTRRHKLLTGDNVGSIVRWTVANEAARLALILSADDNGAVAKQTDDNSYHVLADYSTPTWVQLGNVTSATSSTVAPTPDEDELDGYEVGDFWVKTTATQAVYCLIDKTAGAAVWLNLTSGGGGGTWGSILGTLSDQTDLQAALDAKVTGPATAVDEALARFDGTTGKLLQDGANSTLNDQGHLKLLGAQAAIDLRELAAGPTANPATGHYWVKNTTPTRPFFSDDDANELNLLDHGSQDGLGDDDHSQYVLVDGTRPGTRLAVKARKGSAGTINPGDVVYETGFNIGTGFYEVEKADASDPAKRPPLGVAKDTITNGTEGYVVIVGEVTGINTASFSEGAVVYLSDSVAGQLTATEPTASGSTAEKVGTVLRSNASTGVIDVSIERIEVRRDGTSPQDGVLLTERADHVNAPATGKAEFWVKNATPNDPIFTDDAGYDRQLDTAHGDLGTWFYSVDTTPDTAGEMYCNTSTPSTTTQIILFHDNEQGARMRVALASVGIGGHIMFRANNSYSTLHSFRIDAVTSGATTVTYTVAITNTTGTNDWTAHPEWTAQIVPGPGDVVGPASATDNAIARFDATTGKLIQSSVNAIGDNGNIILGPSAVAGPAIRFSVPTTPPSSSSGNGWYYIGGSGTATTPLFKDGGGTEHQLNIKHIALSGGGRHTGAAITGQWYGQNYWGPWADANMATTWGASSGDPNFNGIANVVPYAGTVTKFVVYYTVNPATVDGEIALWKVGITDGATSSTYTKVASVDLGAAKVDNIAERYVDEVACNTAVNAGDQLVMLLAHTTTGATCFAAYTAIVEYV